MPSPPTRRLSLGDDPDSRTAVKVYLKLSRAQGDYCDGTPCPNVERRSAILRQQTDETVFDPPNLKETWTFVYRITRSSKYGRIPLQCKAMTCGGCSGAFEQALSKSMLWEYTMFPKLLPGIGNIFCCDCSNLKAMIITLWPYDPTTSFAKSGDANPLRRAVKWRRTEGEQEMQSDADIDNHSEYYVTSGDAYMARGEKWHEAVAVFTGIDEKRRKGLVHVSL
ncbi:hypothetical protein BU15DRAFT_68662 [Melanogaster broomeanus]|nr:hypothetical protein BU15DRAFT_68662 [Melanogaster broomeanus]